MTIIGTTDIEGLESYEVSFAYQKDDTNTWFFIATRRPGDAQRGIGHLGYHHDYGRVPTACAFVHFLKDGRTLETMVNGLRVRNYSPVETSTPER